MKTARKKADVRGLLAEAARLSRGHARGNAFPSGRGSASFLNALSLSLSLSLFTSLGAIMDRPFGYGTRGRELLPRACARCLAYFGPFIVWINCKNEAAHLSTSVH